MTPSTTWTAAFAAWEPFCSSHNQVTTCPIWVRQCCGHRQGWTCLCCPAQTVVSPAAAAGSWGPALDLSLCSSPEGLAQCPMPRCSWAGATQGWWGSLGIWLRKHSHGGTRALLSLSALFCSFSSVLWISLAPVALLAFTGCPLPPSPAASGALLGN